MPATTTTVIHQATYVQPAPTVNYMQPGMPMQLQGGMMQLQGGMMQPQYTQAVMPMQPQGGMMQPQYPQAVMQPIPVAVGVAAK